MKKAYLIAAILALGPGCEELDPYLPKVRFQEMRVQQISFEDADVDFIFSVDNPNPVDVELSSFSYNLGLEGMDLLSGDNGDGFGLEAVGSSELVLPMNLIWKEAWNTVQATRGEDFVEFGLDGDFGFETPIGEALIPYDEDGSFPALRTPKIDFSKVRVTKVDMWTQTADVAVDLAIDNEHASNLWFTKFDYDLSFGGNRVATGLIADLGGVEGARTGTLSIPVTVDLVEAGDSVYQALSGNGNLAVGLDATTDVDTPFGVLPLHIDQTGDVQVQSE